jgi:dihydroxyacetone kinase
MRARKDVLHMERPMPEGCRFDAPCSKPAALLVNNLGSVPQLEMSIIAGRAVECLRARHIDVQLMAVGAVVTSLDMKVGPALASY